MKSIALFALLTLCASIATAETNRSADPTTLAKQVTIYRDTYGVPHVFGRTDAATVFGFAYGGKGFITTFEVERTIGFIGKFKLDWIFVKPPALTSGRDKDEEDDDDDRPYVLAPHFGRTLKELNRSIEDCISDHDPLIVDLPLKEPGGSERLALWKH